MLPYPILGNFDQPVPTFLGSLSSEMKLQGTGEQRRTLQCFWWHPHLFSRPQGLPIFLNDIIYTYKIFGNQILNEQVWFLSESTVSIILSHWKQELAESLCLPQVNKITYSLAKEKKWRLVSETSGSKAVWYSLLFWMTNDMLPQKLSSFNWRWFLFCLFFAL